MQELGRTWCTHNARELIEVCTLQYSFHLSISECSGSAVKFIHLQLETSIKPIQTREVFCWVGFFFNNHPKIDQNYPIFAYIKQKLNFCNRGLCCFPFLFILFVELYQSFSGSNSKIYCKTRSEPWFLQNKIGSICCVSFLLILFYYFFDFRIRIVLHHQISASDLQYTLSCFQVTKGKLLCICC